MTRVPLKMRRKCMARFNSLDVSQTGSRELPHISQKIFVGPSLVAIAGECLRSMPSTEVLASMPDVGADADFERVESGKEAQSVFD